MKSFFSPKATVDQANVAPVQRQRTLLKNVIDNRRQTAIQRNLQQLANGSPRVLQAKDASKRLPLDFSPHVMQQKQGQIRPVSQAGEVSINKNTTLEQEAGQLGQLASCPVQLQKTTSPNKQIFGQPLSPASQNTIQRKITVGALKYNAGQAETRIKSLSDFKWKDVYSHILSSLDKTDQRFRSIEELSAQLNFFVEQDASHLNLYKEQAVEGRIVLNPDTQEWEPKYKGWEETYNYTPGTGTSLHDLVYNVISGEGAISGMSYDKIFNYTPKTQLAYCLWECRDSSEEALALCLYTSYFYEPLNSYFRGLSEPDPDTAFGKLILKTAEALKGSYEVQTNEPIEGKRYRLELQSGWIGEDATEIDFKALTSTHPKLEGVNAMWGDVAKGTFGKYDNFALLSFEGTAKIKHPEQKYFPSESEDLMGPGSRYKIIDKYSVEGNIPGIGQTSIRIFRLSNLEEPNIEEERLRFEDVVQPKKISENPRSRKKVGFTP